MEIAPATLAARDRYRLMISSIVPRPIAWVSTVDAQGRPNLAPFSFFTGITAQPMTVCFSPANDRHGRKKDTLLNIEATRQFVINAATEETAQRMVQTSAVIAHGESEFALAGLTPVPSSCVKAPRVQESPLQLECQVKQIVTVSTGPLGGNLVIGEVLRVHVDDKLWDAGLSHKTLKPLGRLEGKWYTRVSDDFKIDRPTS
jgi:flavin reductase (DIM6/NTAB) family NADH-FMN oxidoreductase RutF